MRNSGRIPHLNSDDIRLIRGLLVLIVDGLLDGLRRRLGCVLRMLLVLRMRRIARVRMLHLLLLLRGHVHGPHDGRRNGVVRAAVKLVKRGQFRRIFGRSHVTDRLANHHLLSDVTARSVRRFRRTGHKLARENVLDAFDGQRDLLLVSQAEDSEIFQILPRQLSHILHRSVALPPQTGTVLRQTQKRQPLLQRVRNEFRQSVRYVQLCNFRFEFLPVVGLLDADSSQILMKDFNEKSVTSGGTKCQVSWRCLTSGVMRVMVCMSYPDCTKRS